MALTQIRGTQIRDGVIVNSHVAANAAIAYSKLNLNQSLVASDLNLDESVEQQVLNSKLIALWDMMTGISSGTGSSLNVTASIGSTIANDNPITSVDAEGVLLTGTGTNGAGISNYSVQVRNAATGEPVVDNTDEDPGDAINAGAVYAELRHDGTDYFLHFFNSDGTPYTFTADTSIDVMFVEIFTYQTAPAKGFITGMGFADIVGIAGSHNHNDLYYTQTELDGGQLDNRYYTEGELNGGQLDNRYFREDELNPAAPATGDNVLDARYFREIELTSTASGSSGSGLIGVTSGNGLDAATVQGALNELQSDINEIVGGTLDITHSMDDSYDDGSVVSVDGTNVDFQLADAKQFAITDGAETYFAVLKNNTTGDVVTLSGDTVDVDATAGATITATGSDVALETTTSGNVSITSAGEITTSSTGNQALDSAAELTLKDQHLSVGIPVSEAGETGLVGYTATSIVGALNEALTQANTSSNIGAAEDADYTDGLFVDFVETTPTGTAVDRFNEVLKSLAPKPAPTLSGIGEDNSGVVGNLSFGTSNSIAGYTNHPSLDVGGYYSKAGDAMGIFENSGTLSGQLADNTPSGGANDRPYPAGAFANGDQGTLTLLVNGSAVHTVDLSTAGSGQDVNGNGSGFNLSAATSVQFDNGDDFDVFKYRTGSWRVNVADCTLGYNTIQVDHDGNVTNTLNFVIDGDTTATAYSSESISDLSMTGSTKISGVTYHTGGTATYNVTVSNAYRNTFSDSSNAINFTATNASAPDEAITTPSTEADDISISKAITINSGSRLLDGSVSVNVNVARTLQSTSTSTGASVSGILLDATPANSTATAEYFNDERYRVASSLNETLLAYTSGGNSPSDWDSAQSLVGADAGHNTGLLVYNGALMYPTQGLNGGNFSSVTDGPAENVGINYSSASGDRTYYRFFHTSAPKSNFSLSVNSSSTNFVSVATGPSGNNLTLEVLAPNTTQDSGGTIEWKDMMVPFVDNDGIGCYAATYGSSVPTNWGGTLGTRNTSTSGNVIVIRITASAAWTGSIDGITLTWI